MKKLFFAAIAAMVMVSVSSVFANSAKSEMGLVMATDSTENDTTAPAEQPAQEPTQEPTDSTAKLNPSSDETAWLMSTDSTQVDSSSVDSASLV